MTEDHVLDLDAIEALFRQAMSYAKAQGLTIAPGSFGCVAQTFPDHRWTFYGSTHEPICLISAVLLLIQPRSPSPESLPAALAQLIGRPLRWVYSFLNGFDGLAVAGLEDAYTLGQTLRAEVDAGLWG